MDTGKKNVSTAIDVETYLKERLLDQMRWYDRKSMEAQSKFKILRRIEIVAASMIPFLTGFAQLRFHEIPIMQIVIGVLGVSIAIVSGLLALNKYQEIWVEYRTTAESLKHHLLLFQTRTRPYSGDEQQRYQRLVQNVEGLISKENSDWSGYIKQLAESTPEEKSESGAAG